MSHKKKEEIVRWIGHGVLLLCCVTIVYAHVNLYINGHRQCLRPDLARSTFWLTTPCYALILLIIGQRFSKKEARKIKAQNKLRKLIIGIIATFICLTYLILTAGIQLLIEDAIESRIMIQLEVDGVKQTGIVENYETISSSGRGGRRVEYDRIEFTYRVNNNDTRACYSIRYGRMDKFKVGDTLNFIISASDPEYIMLAE